MGTVWMQGPDGALAGHNQAASESHWVTGLRNANVTLEQRCGEQRGGRLSLEKPGVGLQQSCGSNVGKVSVRARLGGEPRGVSFSL